MSAYIAAYVVVWLTLVAYLARLGAGRRRLRQQFDAYQADVDRGSPSCSRIAA